MKNSSSTKYYLSLGSNLGDRLANLEKAVEFLRETGMVTAVSPVYETKPVDMEPGAGNVYNNAVEMISDLYPMALLNRIKKYEAEMGRDIFNPAKQPRTIDIDILLADNSVMLSDNLEIPHKAMHNRAFVLVPLNRIAPDARHPVLKKTVSELLAALNPGELEKVTAV